MALEYLHSRQILHRDIKLENVLLDGDGYVRLTDFNVAKVLEERRTFSMKGTLFCMAPEVILKKGHDAAADFWSLGVLIFEMVTGGPPFFSADKAELKRQILGLDAHHANLYFPADVPTACRMLLSQLFVRDPKHRLGARRADLPLLKAHSFFGRLNWERLYAKQLPSPLKHSVEMLVQARAAAGARGRHGLHTADHQDMAPSYMSAQHSALVQGWDYVAP
jgi:serine/threonine protein kinase